MRTLGGAKQAKGLDVYAWGIKGIRQRITVWAGSYTGTQDPLV